MTSRTRDPVADALLARYAADGDAASLERLVARLRDDALRVARARVDATEAEDVVQARSSPCSTTPPLASVPAATPAPGS